ncbi:MAG: hypothetical protein ABIM89_18075 [Mycobacteriales bacterium]
MTPLEIASGVVVGTDPTTPPLPPFAGQSPRNALEQAILPALLRGPCIVAFSGGRDSSGMLALGTHVARREGLPLPVPLTITCPDSLAARETAWQELVVRHLRLTDWQRIDVTDELDVIGPHAQAALRAHGPLYPLNAYTYLPMFAYAAGGTLVTGLDGDGLLATWGAQPVADVLARRRRPVPRDALRLGLWTAPGSVRRAVVRHRLRTADTWLTPAADRESRRGEAAEIAGEPTRWDRRVAWWQARRYLSLTKHFDTVLAGAAGVAMSHPLLDGAFLASIAQLGARFGPGDRTAVMRMLMADLLPADLLSRSSKAAFDDLLFNRYTREFAQTWGGTGVDLGLVDPERLRAAWRRPRFPIDSALLLQATWLASH